ncbi:MAG: hypothetical protein HYY93_12640 [Planctomycetes bacterium]|nr:hypothetical protein [Planctomycetota bacterium]
MARFLFVVIPEKGHINPYIGPARMLQHRGHAIAFQAARDVSGYLKACGFDPFFSGDPSRRPPSDDHRGRAFAEHARDPEWLRNWIQSVLLDPVPAQVESLRRVIREWKPDAVAIDSMVYAGAIAATREGVPWASLSSSLNPVISRSIRTELTRTIEWLSPDRERLFAQYDMHPDFRVCDVLSPFLTTVFATKEFVEPDEALPRTLYMVGPSIPPRRLDGGSRRPAVEGFPQAEFDAAVRSGRPIVCASLGSQIYWQPRLWRTIFEAVRGEPVFVVASVGELLGSDELGEVPGNVLAAREIPQLEVLDRASLLISHGGANSVMEALAAGVPVLVSPICNDQPAQAHYLEKAGVGRRLDLNTATAEECRQAIRELLKVHEESLRCAIHPFNLRRESAPPRQAPAAERCRGTFVCLSGAMCPYHKPLCDVHRVAAIRDSFFAAAGSETSGLLLEYLAAARRPLLRPDGFPCSLTVTRAARRVEGLLSCVEGLLSRFQWTLGSPGFVSPRESRLPTFRVRCRELKPLEIWDMEVKRGLLWQNRDDLPAALDMIRRGEPRYRWSRTDSGAAAGFDGLFVLGRGVDRHVFQSFVREPHDYRIRLHRRNWRVLMQKAGARLLARLGHSSGHILDFGQSVLKCLRWRNGRPLEWRALRRDGRALPHLQHGTVDEDIDEARGRLVHAAASFIRDAGPPESVGGCFVFALPCELDDDGIPGPCSYAGLEGYRDFVRDVLEAAGVKLGTAYVMNDAELAALASPGRLGKRVLTITMGYGIGACLRVGDFGYDADWVQHARIDLRPIGD